MIFKTFWEISTFLRQILKKNQTKFEEKYRHFQTIKTKIRHFRWNVDISQTNFENYSDTFSRGILTFRRQIIRKKQTNFQKKMKFLRHILIKSQKHFQENIVPSKICLNLSDFFQICLEPSSRKHRKKYLGFIYLKIWNFILIFQIYLPLEWWK